MKILDINEYGNYLNHVQFLDTQKIKDIIEPYTLEFIDIRDKQVEFGISFPLFIDPFYNYILENKTIPTQEDYFVHYITENEEYFYDRIKYSNNTILGLKARVYRTYPSLVRDIHFSLYLKENMPNNNVIFNITLDSSEGIDILLEDRDTLYGINLYTDTPNAKIGREKKAYRHVKFDNVKYIELPVSFKGSEQHGIHGRKFTLYGDRELKQLSGVLNNER